MKTNFFLALIASSAVISVNFLVACQPKDAKVASSSAQGPSPQGTSDSGGGTGVEGKVFESYIVDPTRLEAFQKFVLPILTNLIDESGKKDESFVRIFKWRTWYLAPVELNKVDKQSLGVSFMKNETQQIARQSMKSVWIDKKAFEQMSLEEQGDLLLHEFVMSVYFAKFMTVQNICDLAFLANDPNTKGCAELPKKLPKILEPEPTRKLDDVDNENIRFVTGWLKQNGKSEIKIRDFYKVLKIKNFDQRFFNPNNLNKSSDGKADKITISRAQFVDLFRAGSLTKTLPNKCVDIDGNAMGECNLIWSEVQAKFGVYSIPAMRLTINAKTSETFDFFLADSMELGWQSNTDGQVLYNLVVTQNREKFHVGDAVMTAMFVLQKNAQEDVSLSSIFVRRGVVTSIDKTAKNVCRVSPVNSNDAFDRGFVMFNNSASPSDYDTWIFEEFPLYASCTADNVE